MIGTQTPPCASVAKVRENQGILCDPPAKCLTFVLFTQQCPQRTSILLPNCQAGPHMAALGLLLAPCDFLGASPRFPVALVFGLRTDLLVRITSSVAPTSESTPKLMLPASFLNAIRLNLF